MRINISISFLVTILFTTAFVAAFLAVGLLWLYQNTTASIQNIHTEALIRLPERLPINTRVTTDLSVDIDEKFDVQVPIKNQFPIYLDNFKAIDVAFNADIPLDFNVRVSQVIPVSTQVPINSVVQVKVFGITKDVEVSGMVPIEAEAPVDLVIPIRQTLPISYRGPIDLITQGPVYVPIDTQIATQVPIKSRVNIPLDVDINTNVALLGKGSEAQIVLPKTDIPLNEVRIQLNSETIQDLRQRIRRGFDQQLIKRGWGKYAEGEETPNSEAELP